MANPSEKNKPVLCNHICITEDRLENVINKSLQKYQEEVEKFCNQNIKNNFNEHLLDTTKIHITKEEKGLIYDANNYVKTNAKKKSPIVVKLGLPITIIGLIIERIINYFSGE